MHCNAEVHGRPHPRKTNRSLLIGRQTSKWFYEMWSSMKITRGKINWTYEINLHKIILNNMG